MTEREKSEICKGYADLIIKKEKLIREIWEIEFAIKKIWTDQEREALRIMKEEKQVKYYNKTPIKVETIKQYEEYVNAVKYWQSIKKYDGKRKEGNMQSICRPDHKEGC